MHNKKSDFENIHDHVCHQAPRPFSPGTRTLAVTPRRARLAQSSSQKGRSSSSSSSSSAAAGVGVADTTEVVAATTLEVDTTGTAGVAPAGMAVMGSDEGAGGAPNSEATQRTYATRLRNGAPGVPERDGNAPRQCRCWCSRR